MQVNYRESPQVGPNCWNCLKNLQDTDQDGRVSEEHYMTLMEAEFNRLDKAKTGALDVRELTKSAETASRFAGK